MKNQQPLVEKHTSSSHEAQEIKRSEPSTSTDQSIKTLDIEMTQTKDHEKQKTCWDTLNVYNQVAENGMNLEHHPSYS